MYIKYISTPTPMLRRLLALVLSLSLLGISLLPAAAYDYTYNPFAATTVPTFQFPESPYAPGGPLLTPILNNWLYWGNAFNWLPGGSTTYNYNTTGYGYTLPTQQMYAPYIDVQTTSAPVVAPYVGVPTQLPIGQMSAPYIQTSKTASPVSQMKVPYIQTEQKTTQMTAPYAAPTASTSTMSANYSAPVAAAPITQMKANYLPTVATASPISTMKAPYLGTVQNATSTVRANYDAPATSNRSNTLVWPAAGGSSARNNSGITANYIDASTSSGAAFGSVFGDGRDPAFEGSAVDSFVNRLKSQTSDSVTSRAESLSSRDYVSYFDVNPVVTYNPATDYDRAFSQPRVPNLNGTPVATTPTPAQAVTQTAQNIALTTPLTHSSSYLQDVQALEIRGIRLPEGWKNRTQQTPLTRRDIAELAVHARGWRETGDPKFVSSWDTYKNFLPIIGDMITSDPAYMTFLIMANERILYMPNAKEKDGRLVYVEADQNGAAQRGQSLQALMTALQMRPNAALVNAGYTDLPKDAWYTTWALTARSYGLNFGGQFSYNAVVSQEEAVHMLAVLLQQFR